MTVFFRLYTIKNLQAIQSLFSCGVGCPSFVRIFDGDPTPLWEIFTKIGANAISRISIGQSILIFLEIPVFLFKALIFSDNEVMQTEK